MALSNKDVLLEPSHARPFLPCPGLLPCVGDSFIGSSSPWGPPCSPPLLSTVNHGDRLTCADGINQNAVEIYFLSCYMSPDLVSSALPLHRQGLRYFRSDPFREVRLSFRRARESLGMQLAAALMAGL